MVGFRHASRVSTGRHPQPFDGGSGVVGLTSEGQKRGKLEKDIPKQTSGKFAADVGKADEHTHGTRQATKTSVSPRGLLGDERQPGSLTGRPSEDHAQRSSVS